VGVKVKRGRGGGRVYKGHKVGSKGSEKGTVGEDLTGKVRGGNGR